jgi:hypothetical protein
MKFKKGDMLMKGKTKRLIGIILLIVMLAGVTPLQWR